MHYSQLIKVPNYLDTGNHNPVSKVDSIDSAKIDQLIKMFETYGVSSQAPPSLENSELNDDEIDKVLCYLLRLQSEYFNDVPLSRDLCKKFMWNIPRNVYNSFQKAIALDEPDILNPLMFFYIFCVDDPYFAMGKFVNIINNLIGPDEMELIENKIELYDQNNYEDE